MGQKVAQLRSARRCLHEIHGRRVGAHANTPEKRSSQGPSMYLAPGSTTYVAWPANVVTSAPSRGASLSCLPCRLPGPAHIFFPLDHLALCHNGPLPCAKCCRVMLCPSRGLVLSASLSLPVCTIPGPVVLDAWRAASFASCLSRPSAALSQRQGYLCPAIKQTRQHVPVASPLTLVPRPPLPPSTRSPPILVVLVVL